MLLVPRNAGTLSLQDILLMCCAAASSPNINHRGWQLRFYFALGLGYLELMSN
jgi:hypothetical protein